MSLDPSDGSAEPTLEIEACVTCEDENSGEESSPDDDRITFDGCGPDCALNPESERTGSDGCVRTTLRNENDGENTAFVTVEAFSDTGAFEAGNYELPPPTPTPTPGVPLGGS